MESTPVRCGQRWAIAIAALIFGPLFVLGVFAIAILIYSNGSKVFGIALVFGAGWIAYQMVENYSWVEIDGDIIRGKRFWTRQTVQQNLDDITKIEPMRTPLAGFVTNAMLDHILRTKNRGFLIWFESGPRIALIRGDMHGVDELIIAIHDRLGERWAQVYVPEQLR